MTTRAVHEKIHAKATMEGAGVRLHRGFGFYEKPRFDPFLLFDDFSSEEPEDYLLGFPWHPHRGIETVTYIVRGEVAHGDSIGNAGVIGDGQVQWMTAGSGIIHHEMPRGLNGLVGFQLWVNLPKAEKMNPPRYQEYSAQEFPEIPLGPHASAKVIAGGVQDVDGPVEDITVGPTYVDISLKSGEVEFPVIDGHTVFLYIFDGNLSVDREHRTSYSRGDVVLFEREGDTVYVKAGNGGARFVLISGKPLGEPIAWNGPIVMNTPQELEKAFYEIKVGSFVKE